MSGSCLLTATDLILEHYHCYPHIILNVAMTLFLPVSPFLLFFSMSLMSLNNRVRRILMVSLHCLFFLIISPHLIGRVEECITYYCYRWLSLLIGTQERGFGCYLVSICEHRYCSFMAIQLVRWLGCCKFASATSYPIFPRPSNPSIEAYNQYLSLITKSWQIWSFSAKHSRSTRAPGVWRLSGRNASIWVEYASHVCFLKSNLVCGLLVNVSRSQRRRV